MVVTRWFFAYFVVSGTWISDQDRPQQSRLPWVPWADASLRCLILEPLSAHQCNWATASIRRFISVASFFGAAYSPRPVPAWRDLVAAGSVRCCCECDRDEARSCTPTRHQSSCPRRTCVRVHRCVQPSLQRFRRHQRRLGWRCHPPSTVCAVLSWQELLTVCRAWQMQRHS